MEVSQLRYKIRAIVALFVHSSILGLSMNSFAQLPLSSVDFNRIPQKKVRNLVRQQHCEGIVFFSDIKSTCYSERDSISYSFQRSSHTIKEKIQNVWIRLKSLKPKDEYNGKIVSFGFLYSNKLNRIFYIDDDYKEIEEGEIIYLNLKLLGGVKNLAVAIEVTKVDDINKTIQFCYIENGMSEGTQQIKLTENDDGNTEISQETRYRNRSKFREKKLYPIFHHQAVSELHTNLKVLIEGFPLHSNH